MSKKNQMKGTDPREKPRYQSTCTPCSNELRKARYQLVKKTKSKKREKDKNLLFKDQSINLIFKNHLSNKDMQKIIEDYIKAIYALS